MAYKNSATVYIGGRNYTFATVMPIKWGNLLDERLDEMYLSLRKVKKQNFAPLTPVEIHFSNQLYFGSTDVDAPQTATKRYIIADDENVTENPVGSGWYDHDLYLIELTKILECVVVDTNTFTNILRRDYTIGSAIPSIDVEASPGVDPSDYKPVTPSTFTSALPVGSFFFPSAKTVFPYSAQSGGLSLSEDWRFEQTISESGASILFHNTYIEEYNGCSKHRSCDNYYKIVAVVH